MVPCPLESVGNHFDALRGDQGVKQLHNKLHNMQDAGLACSLMMSDLKTVLWLPRSTGSPKGPISRALHRTSVSIFPSLFLCGCPLTDTERPDANALVPRRKSQDVPVDASSVTQHYHATQLANARRRRGPGGGHGNRGHVVRFAGPEDLRLVFLDLRRWRRGSAEVADVTDDYDTANRGIMTLLPCPKVVLRNPPILGPRVVVRRGGNPSVRWRIFFTHFCCWYMPTWAGCNQARFSTE